MLKQLRNAFFTGLIIILPLGITFIVIHFLITKIGAPSSNFIFWFLDSNVRNHVWVQTLLDVASTIIVFLLITLLGIFSKYFFGRMLVNLTEKIFNALPFINTVYKTVKQIVDTFGKEHRAIFQKAVLVQYPRKGIYSLGFLTSTTQGEVQHKTKENVLNIFIPTTPNPTSGFLLLIPEDQVTFLDMSIGDCMKMIISGGAVVPGYENQVIKQPELPDNIDQ